MSCFLGDGVIRTFTGKAFNILKPSPDDICIEDIAHALSNICRFTGQVQKFYSVAQHSVLVCKELLYCKLDGLLHDAHEAYIGDFSRPFKAGMPPELKAYIKEVILNIDIAVGEKFGLEKEWFTNPMIHQADDLILAAEGRDLMKDWRSDINTNCVESVVPMPPIIANRDFLHIYNVYK